MEELLELRGDHWPGGGKGTPGKVDRQCSRSRGHFALRQQTIARFVPREELEEFFILSDLELDRERSDRHRRRENSVYKKFLAAGVIAECRHKSRPILICATAARSDQVK